MKLFLVACALVVAGCQRPASSFNPELGLVADAGSSIGERCACQFATPQAVGDLADPELIELSGLVASHVHSGVLYAHNDSGDVPRFFALSTTGAALARFTLPGATASDWEDIARGPCDAGSCLYLGDIGDNRMVRTDYAIYRVPEPALPDAGSTVSVAFERFAFQYPGGDKHNCEALLAHPVTGRLYVVTKEGTAPSQVYRFPESLDPVGVNVLDYVTTLTVPTATDNPLTAADVSPCGDAVLLRMYNRLVELRLPEGETDFEKLFSAVPVQVAVANEPQGEAVAYSADGRSFFTASEKLAPTVPLYESRCR